ncbi:hypothetical protein ACN8ZM_17410 [Burkholderia aenigmatica]|uniref:hypothetical protein n=1 Tax=Burkholderia aenigmatica TaxID=2015348 RepID=UPI003B4340C5
MLDEIVGDSLTSSDDARRVDGVQRLLDAGVTPSAKVLADAADTPEILRLLKASAAH